MVENIKKCRLRWVELKRGQNGRIKDVSSQSYVKERGRDEGYV